MKFRSVLNSVVIGAGICIFVIGLALAQTTPTPAPSPAPAAPQVAPPQEAPPATAPSVPYDRRAMRAACRDKIDSALRGPERREAMRKCRNEAQQSVREERRAQRESRREMRKSCRVALKDQRFTEDERKAAIQECVAKKDPKFGKLLACRKEAQDKKLERRTPELRAFMRECTSRT